MKRHTSLARDQRGVAALEFVLVMPFLLLILFGIIDTSLLLCDKAVLTRAAGEASRAGTVLRAKPLTDNQIRNIALAHMEGNLVTAGTATTPTVTVLPSGGCGGGSGDALRVSVDYTYTGIVLGSVLSSLTGPVTISASAVKYCE